MSTGPSFNSPHRESETKPRRSSQSEAGRRPATHANSSEARDPAHSDFGIRHSDFPPPSRHRRRIRIHPTEYDEILADAIYDLVRLHGHSDVAAAACYGVSASAIKRWLREHEDFAADLDAARAEFKEGIVEKIRYATKRDGTLDWRARAWLLERTFPDEFGRPGKKAEPTDVEKYPDNPKTWDEAMQCEPGSYILTPTLLVDLQRVRKAASIVEYAVEDSLRDRLADQLFEEWKNSQNSPTPVPSNRPASAHPAASLHSQPSTLNLQPPPKPTTIDPHPRLPGKLRPPTQAEIDARNRMLAEFIAAEPDEEEYP
jgi:hypothetical protein